MSESFERRGFSTRIARRTGQAPEETVKEERPRRRFRRTPGGDLVFLVVGILRRGKRSSPE